MSTTSSDAPSMGDFLKKIGDAFESDQNRFNRAMFQAHSARDQEQILQNGKNNGLTVKTLSKMTGVPASTIYSKIHID